MEFIAQYHPYIVHFPIALFSLYIFTELTALIIKNDKLKFMSQVLISAGVIFSVAAVLTGNMSAQVAKEIISTKALTDITGFIENHETNATLLLWYFLFIFIIRTFFVLKKKFSAKRQILVVVLAVFGFYFIYMTGYSGGELVYKHGVGTEWIKTK